VLAGYTLRDHRSPGVLILLEDFHLHHLASELSRTLEGRHLKTAEWADKTMVRLHWRSGDKPTLILLHPSFPACVPVSRRSLADEIKWTPAFPLQDRLVGLRLEKVSKLFDERILTFTFFHPDGPLKLLAELRPIVPGLYLSDSRDKVIFSLGSHWSSGKQMDLAPRIGRLKPDHHTLIPLLKDIHTKKALSVLSRRVQQLSPTLVEEALARSPHPSPPHEMAIVLEQVAAQAYEPSTHFFLYTRNTWSEKDYRLNPRKDFRFSGFPLQSCTGWREYSYKEPSAAIDDWIAYALRYELFQVRREKVTTALDSQVEETSRKIFSLQGQLDAAEKGDVFKKYGELILVNIHRFGTGFRADTIEVQDFYVSEKPQLLIPLNPGKTLKENADRYFRIYRKAQTARERLPQLLEKVGIRLSKFNRLRDEAAGCSTFEALKSLSEKLSSRKSARATVNIRERKVQKSYQFRQYETRNGLTVLVGKSADDNDRLTFRVARPDDIWFHVMDYRGSHVVLSWGKKEDPPPADLLDAAGVAAYFSGARKSPVVDVHWTRRKYVTRIKGVPGRVRLSRSHTMRVPPALPGASPKL